MSILNKCHFGINQELVNIFILQAEVFREANEIKREDQRCHVFSPSSLRPCAHCLIDRTQWLISGYVNVVFLLPPPRGTQRLSHLRYGLYVCNDKKNRVWRQTEPSLYLTFKLHVSKCHTVSVHPDVSTVLSILYWLFL